MRDLFSSFGWNEGISGVYTDPSGAYTIDTNSKMLINKEGYREYLSSINPSLLEALTGNKRRINVTFRFTDKMGV